MIAFGISDSKIELAITIEVGQSQAGRRSANPAPGFLLPSVPEFCLTLHPNANAAMSGPLIKVESERFNGSRARAFRCLIRFATLYCP